MNKSKRLLCRMIALSLLLATTVVPEALAAEQKSKEIKPKAPIVVEADDLSFSDGTGDILAKGNVTITQGQDKLLGDLIQGNTKKTELWITGDATFIQQRTKITGSNTIYNYGTHTGTMAKASGKVDRELIKGSNIDILPKELIIHDGTMTTCPARIPDYHVSATKVEIWPGDKMIAYNAKLWIKDKVILSLPKYQKSLKDDTVEFPRIGYNNQDGLYISEYLEVPVSPVVAGFVDLAYYTKRGFTPTYGLVNRATNYTMKVVQGDFKDADNHWIRKEPEFRFDSASHRLGKLPVSYSAYAIYGKWTDESKSSWHQDYNLYFSGDPIKFSKTLRLYLGTGIQQVRESYNDSITNSFRYDATLAKDWSPKFGTWTAFHQTKVNQTWAYNSTDVAKQFDVGFNYRIDRMNAVSFVQTYDVEKGKIYDQDYTWKRNLHCWDASITYRAKRQQWTWDLSVTRW